MTANASPATADSRGLFHAGDKVQLTGPKGRMHTFILKSGETFHTSTGGVKHDDVIGQMDGSVVANARGTKYLAFRPLLIDEVISMPRGAAIVYPKDAAQICAMADIKPGDRVIEAGVGSGALSLWLLRALAGNGRLYSFERREEFAEIAKANVGQYFRGALANWQVTVGDLQDELSSVVEPQTADSVILDMLAPWEPIPQIVQALRPGGTIVVYVATVTQLSRATEAIRGTGVFANPTVSETIVREWHVEGLAVRPEHRMIGHTGFLVTARRMADGVDLPEITKRPSKEAYAEEDMEIWTPGALGERNVVDKRLRKTVRAAQNQITDRGME